MKLEDIDKTGKSYTNEQEAFITFTDKNNIILLACAGSGKTQCIAMRILFLITTNTYKSDEIMMLTFSRNTQQDFIKRIKKIDVNNIININNIRTIDSLAKEVIDPNNIVDVNLLSYRFMKYLETIDTDNLKKNKRLNKIKLILVDEAQDLNETQYKIINNLHSKFNIIINMIGDPNQNIYQFRNSSDKYLMNFPGQRFYLTYNFRSSQPIINFSKHLRPYQETDIKMGQMKLKDINYLPNIFFVKNDFDSDLKFALEEIKDKNINFKNVAILAPTRGGIYGNNANGLCLITHILTKHNFKFKQWYEEADDINNNIQYEPLDDHINVLTYMGSKGLEWEIVIIIDADVCLINKNIFNPEKHNHDRYLLYVATSRPTNNLIIFSKLKEYKKGNNYNIEIKLNPWFKEIPKELYNFDGVDELTFPELFEKDKRDIEHSVTKLLNKLSEEDLDNLCNMYNFENIEKKITKLYSVNIKDDNFISPIFLGRFMEFIFVTFYRLSHNMEKYIFPEIEKIINTEKIIRTNYAKRILTDWFNVNKNLSWEEYDRVKNTYSPDLNEQINKFFDRKYKLNKHLIVADGFYDDYIIKNKDKIKKNYDNYLKTKNKSKLIESVFNIVLLNYVLETQHYFHMSNDGTKFRDLLNIYDKLINNVIKFAKNNKNNFINNVNITYEDIEGEIDLLTDNGEIYEIKCVKDINIKHFLQVLTYNVMHNNYPEGSLAYTKPLGEGSLACTKPLGEGSLACTKPLGEGSLACTKPFGKGSNQKIVINFYNLYRGLEINYILETDKALEIIKILQKYIN
jgi:hypothetical protein